MDVGGPRRVGRPQAALPGAQGGRPKIEQAGDLLNAVLALVWRQGGIHAARLGPWRATFNLLYKVLENPREWLGPQRGRWGSHWLSRTARGGTWAGVGDCMPGLLGRRPSAEGAPREAGVSSGGA